ncbi:MULTISPECIES: glycosyltransferase family 4 protein [unclassified Ruegeria]|uniref:glycosyltransferase family 4 protein n=1 Tax=unclassified Ruegeria TaxID=2625375 RepID=UPI001ADAD3C1|nr:MULTISPECIES: glycosyltransferase family 4 protein [unclassified Ruegeria]MBO9410780.1 glycosyltransferase family 4 protein [Ruegeria sp. R8_1]MBO9414981.1 glycosyltransferase family 4 protein [Ruegeria sp. R8_2]
MTRKKILHLVDDMTAGGVMRMLDHLLAQSDLSGAVEQKVLKVKRTAFSWGNLNADVIVSHVVPSWRSLPAFSALRAMHLDTRLVHVEHSYTRAFTTLNVPHKRRFFAMLRVIYSFFDQVVAVSHAQSDWMKERRLAASEKLTVIPPIVDLEELSQKTMPPKSKTTIGAIGRLERQKGFDILIRGFRSTHIPEARLLIFGEGSQRSHLEELAKGDPRIEFRGHAEDPADAYQAVDIVAIPSRWEAYGLVLDEALAAGRAIIASKVDGLGDREGDARVSFCDQDSASWQSAIDECLRPAIAATRS